MQARLRLGLAVIAGALLAGLAACGPGTVNSENRYVLTLAGPADVTVAPGESVDLAWLLLRQSTGPAEGRSIAFTVVAAGDDGVTLSRPDAATDAEGLAATTLTAGDHALALPIQVQGAVADLPSGDLVPEPVAFTVHVVDAVRALRPEPPDRTRFDGLTGGRVTLAVRATTGGARPLTNETITWAVDAGGTGAARMSEATTLTDLTGIARGTLECGTAASILTVRASMEGTEPVAFTVDVAEWGSCDDAHPCPTGWTCTGGACIEPAVECTADDECPGEERCRFGDCVTVSGGAPCKRDEECGPGETCVYGECTPCEGSECPCTAASDCPEGFVCEEGVCICPPDNPDCGGDPPTCEVVDPDLAGVWDIDSTLRLREALPDWLDDTLGFLGPPFRFLSEGILGGFDFDIPIIGDALGDAADSLVDRYVPHWVGELLGAIADLNDILSTLGVSQEMTLWGAGVRDQYAGELLWKEVEMTWRGDPVVGRIEDITGLTVEHDSIEAEAICGTFYVHRHDVSIGFGYIVRWLLDVIVTAVSEGEYFSLEDLLLDLTTYCDDLAMALDDLAWELSESLDITLPDVYGIAYGACEAGITAGTEAAIDWLESITVHGAAMTLGGHATIAGPDTLEDGRWDGSLLWGDFSGDWTATRR